MAFDIKRRLFWSFRANYSVYIISKSSLEFFHLSKFAYKEPRRLIWQAWQAHLGAENHFFFQIMAVF